MIKTFKNIKSEDKNEEEKSNLFSASCKVFIFSVCKNFKLSLFEFCI